MEEYIRGIPSGLLTAQIGEREIQVVGISENGFEFRLEKEAAGQCQALPDAAPARRIASGTPWKVCFYDLEQAVWQELVLTEFELEKAPALSQAGDKEKLCAASFYQLYRVRVTSPEFRTAVQKLFLQYTRYIHLKLEEDDAGLAGAMVGYPVELEDCFAGSLEEQKRKWFAQADWEALLRPYPSFAIELDRPEWYDAYLEKSLPDFMADYWEKNCVVPSLRSRRLPDRIYIGNQFCRLLFPKKESLFALLEKARREGVDVTVSFASQPEVSFKETEQLLERLQSWCRKNGAIEIVVNDWGTALIVSRYPEQFELCMGTLLNKRKKDPRLSYLKARLPDKDIGLLAKNSLNAAFYRETLYKSFGFVRWEWESCGYPQRFPEGKNSLHLPFYQTNTSQYCTLFAQCREHNRGRQYLQTECPGYCRTKTFLYPEHLHMVGRYNSLFALDQTALRMAETGGAGNAAFDGAAPSQGNTVYVSAEPGADNASLSGIEYATQPDRAVLNLL